MQKNLPLNLLYETEEGYLIESPYLWLNQKILGFVVGNVAYGLKEYAMPWMNAAKFMTEKHLGSFLPCMPKPRELTAMLLESLKVNALLKILQENGVEADLLNGEYYWSDQYYFCETYFAVKKRTLQTLPCCGQSALSFRLCLRLK